MESLPQTTAVVPVANKAPEPAPVVSAQSLADLLLTSPRLPQQCPATVYLANDLNTTASRRGVTSHLRRVSRFLSLDRTDDPRLIDWPRLTQTLVARVRSWLLEDGAAPGTVNTCLAAIRGVLKQAWRIGWMTTDAYHRAIDVPRARGGRVDRVGRMLPDNEVRALMMACYDDPTPAGPRDAAIFALAIGAGLRRAELAAAKIDDLRHEEDGRQSLIVRGKGNKERAVALCSDARRALVHWFEVRGTEPGPLFVAVDKHGTMRPGDGHLCGSSIGRMMEKRGAQANIAKFSPHDCRRTFISGRLDRGVDISTVAQLAGHSSVTTTERYDRRGFRATQTAVEDIPLFVPHRQPA